MMELSSYKQAPQGPNTPEGNPVVAAVAADQLASVQAALQEKSIENALLDWQPPGLPGTSEKRTLCMIAAYHGATSVLAFLLARGADPTTRSPSDGFTALHCACAGASHKCYEAIQLLLCAGADKDAADAQGRKAVDLLLHVIEGAQGNSVSSFAPSPESKDDFQHCLDWPEHCTDEFRMYSFKVVNCPNAGAHDWTDCPFAHPGEKARRRDPRLYRYTGVACPDFRKGSCKRGDGCPFGHGVFECWLHPSRYRTQLCKDAPSCTRRVCFFAHQISELRATSSCGLLATDASSAPFTDTTGSVNSDATEMQLSCLSRSSSSSDCMDASSSDTGRLRRRGGAQGQRACGAAPGALSLGLQPSLSGSGQQLLEAAVSAAAHDALPLCTSFGSLGFDGAAAVSSAAQQLTPTRQSAALQAGGCGAGSSGGGAFPGSQLFAPPLVSDGGASAAPFLASCFASMPPTTIASAAHSILLQIQQQQAMAVAAAAAAAATKHLGGGGGGGSIWDPRCDAVMSSAAAAVLAAAGMAPGAADFSSTFEGLTLPRGGAHHYHPGSGGAYF